MRSSRKRKDNSQYRRKLFVNHVSDKGLDSRIKNFQLKNKKTTQLEYGQGI